MRMLIVDDDDQIREGMMYGIQWENLGIEQVDGCKNGGEALALLDAQKYDLVITDISMPVMSGIELMKAVRERNEETHFILISGYQEFEYAQAGVRYGADDYILKPIHIDELLETINKVLERVEKQYEVIRNRNVQKKLEQEKRIKQILFRQIESETEIRKILKNNCGFRRIDALIGAVIQIQLKKEITEETRNCFIKKVTESLAGYTYTGCEINDGGFFFLIDVPDSTLLIYQMRQKIGSMIRQINQEVKDVRFRIGISESGYPRAIADLYEEAGNVLEEQWIHGEEDVFFSQRTKTSAFEGGGWNEKITEGIRKSRWEDVEQILGQLEQELLKNRKQEVLEYMRESIHEILYQIGKYKSDKELKAAFEKAGSFQEAWRLWKFWLYEVYTEYNQIKAYGREVHKAMRYVRKHYMEKITLEDVAKEVELSAGYFGRIFKKQNFVC